ncbi:unnamed protein product [Pleuronectes platessa]|uniref:Uncharacterized protein n=1 Tax=Pleuronectes platessa TaxID=8262 RepID=A0A9N7VYS7_PLEPL|nr:unnamed protein product [Pleuronectes platessa]
MSMHSVHVSMLSSRHEAQLGDRPGARALRCRGSAAGSSVEVVHVLVHAGSLWILDLQIHRKQIKTRSSSSGTLLSLRDTETNWRLHSTRAEAGGGNLGPKASRFRLHRVWWACR